MTSEVVRYEIKKLHYLNLDLKILTEKLVGPSQRTETELGSSVRGLTTQVLLVEVLTIEEVQVHESCFL
jgi:hypothetical protein